MSPKIITDIAEAFDRFGPWAVSAVYLVGLIVLARYVAVLNRRIERIHEAHRLALEKVNEQRHTTTVNALRDVSEIVREHTTALVEMRHSIAERE